MKYLPLLLAVGTAIFTTNSFATGTDWRSNVDFSRADLQPFSMVLIKDGVAAGSMAYSMRLDGNTYIIEDRTEMEPNILETATGVLDAATLMPRTVDIDFAVGENRTVFDFEWNNSVLSGEVTISQSEQPERIVPVNSNDNAVLRMAVFGIISALPLADGFQTELPWFNTLSNKTETVQIIHAGQETIKTPAGTFKAHKVNLKGGTPENIIHVSTALPQKIVRIDVVGQPLHFERSTAS